MADRNLRFPAQGQGFGMMQGGPQFVQPGMQQFPTMQQQMVMGHGQPMMPQSQPMMSHGQRMMPQGMYPVNMMGMRMGPTGAPPAYNKHMQDNFQNRKREVTTGARNAGKSEEQIRKERQYQQQRDKLKQFGKPTAGGLDPNKLVDSIFGTSDKPKTKPANITIPPEPDSSDNNFGEFLSSPPASQTEQEGTGLVNGSSLTASQSTANPIALTTIVPGKPPLQQSQIVPPKKDKKDLEKMMFECSDLKAPQKAKLFQKPALKELHPTHHQTQVPVHHDSQNARKWNQTEELSDLFIQEAVKDVQTMPKKPVPKHTSPTSKHPPKPPPWLSDETLLPEIYKHVLEASLVDGRIFTERLYPILMLSGLPKELMGHIWSLCNKVTPGQLIKAELYQMLALIALAQNNYQIVSVDILSRCPHPPVPRLQQQGPPQHLPQGPQIPPQGVPQGLQIFEQGQQQIVSQGPPVAFAGVAQGSQIAQQGLPAQVPPVAQQGLPAQVPPVAQQGLPAQVPPIAQQELPMQGPPTTQQGSSTQGPPTAQQGLPTQGPPITQQGLPPLGPPAIHQGLPASFPSPQQGPVSIAQGAQGVQSQAPQSMTTNIPHVVSAPATLHVTQLPPAGVPQGMIGMTAMTTEEDDFADFQAAPPTTTQPAVSQPSGSFGDLMSDVKNERRSSVKDQAKYLYSVPTPDDAAIAATLSAQDLQHSNVENFFGSDDSSEGMASHNSLDDEYFDGYKSADSKPSDSTSQFSTDQSENEDFKNFENYLDEFQKRKEEKEKDSPFHRAVTKSSPVKEVGSPSKVFPKIIPQKLPEPRSQQTSLATISTDEFTDFADFQSAPASESKQTLEANVGSNVPSDQLKASGSKSELIGEEDKYAALRVLDFSSLTNSGSDEATDNPKLVSENDDNWADFQNAAFDDEQNNTTNSEQPQNELICGNESNVVPASSTWADFESAMVLDSEDNVELSPVDDLSKPASIPMTVTAAGFRNNSAQVSESFSGHDLDPGNDDWANFQENNDGDFSAFQSSTNDFTSLKSDSEETPSGLVNVKKGELGKDEILGLFKVKSSPVTVLKSRDDDINLYEPPKNETFDSNIETKENIADAHFSSKRKAFSVPRISEGDDDFMGPPPVDHFVDDAHDDYEAYSRGYDFDDMIMPPRKEEKEHKNIYGVYGLNQNFVVTGHRKDDKSIHIEKDQNDDDSDSISSKDNDILRPKFIVGKDNAEDSQSVSSLEFVMNKRVQNLKDSESLKDLESADTQSVSSFEFGNFENTSNKDILPESKSLDSLDLRKEDISDDTNDSQENSDKDKDSLDKEIADDVVLADLERIPTPDSGLPVIGDRYSNILHDIPGSDKHAYEWQRCLDNCCRMIKDANNIFNSVSSSAVCNEIIKSTQGSEYVSGIIEIYRVVCKISLSIKKAAVQTDRLQQLLKDIDLAWNNLAAFLVGGSIMPDPKSLDFSQGLLMDDDMTAQYLACGVCLLNVDMKLKGAGQENGNSVAKLTYGGRQYHAPCANLWINCVDSTLPALKLPELL